MLQDGKCVSEAAYSDIGHVGYQQPTTGYHERGDTLVPQRRIGWGRGVARTCIPAYP